MDVVFSPGRGGGEAGPDRPCLKSSPLCPRFVVLASPETLQSAPNSVALSSYNGSKTTFLVSNRSRRASRGPSDPISEKEQDYVYREIARQDYEPTFDMGPDARHSTVNMKEGLWA